MRRSWRPNRTATYWPPLLWPSAFLSRSPELLNRGPGAQPVWVLVFSTASFLQLVWSPNWIIGGLRAPSAGCWLFLLHLVSNWLTLLCTQLYNSSSPTFFLWASQITHIQPIHGQNYTLLFLDRMHLLFTQVHFLFWQPGRVVGQQQFSTTLYTWVWPQVHICKDFEQAENVSRSVWHGLYISESMCPFSLRFLASGRRSYVDRRKNNIARGFIDIKVFHERPIG